MDATMDIEVEHQITQPESQVSVMENCYEEALLEELFTTEEVQTRSQAQKQGQKHQRSQPQFQKHQYAGTEDLPGKSKLQQIQLWIRLQVPVQQGKLPETMVTKPCTRDNTHLLPVNNLCNS